MKLPLAEHPGCYNRNGYVGGYYVMDRQYLPSGDWRVVHRPIINAMSKLCRSDYDINKERRCKGCTVPQDIKYFKEQGLL